MKKLLFLIVAVVLFSIESKAQFNFSSGESEILSKRGEIIISFKRPENLNAIGKIISIDKVTSDSVIAYCNKEDLMKFKKTGIDYLIVENQLNRINVKMCENIESLILNNWNSYPTYSQYDSILHYYSNAFPQLCKYVEIGTLNSGRKIMALKLGDNVNQQENEPRFLYTSSMHGDELTGYILMLRLIDYLLTNYGTNPEVTYLMNNLEIWINPLANPDGTFKGGNNTVSGATRGNALNVDFNRNFPDPQDGQHPDGKVWQEETKIFMKLADSLQFTMSANFHGGAEVINYPWDTWSKLSADNSWWVKVSKRFADSSKYYGPSSYFTDTDPSGYINGYTWYTISGGRQDYMNYFGKCREVTVEISSTKTPQASQLPNYWNYNYHSLLNYMKECCYSLNGTITDSLTGLPLKAKVFINNWDKDSSHVYSSINGDYYRLLYAGNYQITYSCDGYNPKTLSTSISNDVAQIQNVQLAPIGIGINEKEQSQTLILYPNPSGEYLFFNIENQIEIQSFKICTITGNICLSNENSGNRIEISSLKSGIYNIRIELKNGEIINKTFVKQ